MLCEQEQVAQLITDAQRDRSVLLAHLRGHPRKRHMILQVCLGLRRVAADPNPYWMANSSIGWVHKHTLELPDRSEVNVRATTLSAVASAAPECTTGHANRSVFFWRLAPRSQQNIPGMLHCTSTCTIVLCSNVMADTRGLSPLGTARRRAGGYQVDSDVRRLAKQQR